GGGVSPARGVRGGPGGAGRRRRGASRGRRDGGARPGAHMIVRSTPATPSGTVAAGPRGCAPRLFASSVGTSRVGNGRSSPPAGAGLGTGAGTPARVIVSARQISSPARTEAY